MNSVHSFGSLLNFVLFPTALTSSSKSIRIDGPLSSSYCPLLTAQTKAPKKQRATPRLIANKRMITLIENKDAAKEVIC